MNPKIFYALCITLILAIISCSGIIVLLFFISTIPAWLSDFFLADCLVVLILGPTVCYLSRYFPTKHEEKTADLTISKIRSVTHPHFSGSFMGVLEVNPALRLICVRDFDTFIMSGEIVHVDVFMSGSPSDAVHVVEKRLWVPPAHFQIAYESTKNENEIS